MVKTLLLILIGLSASIDFIKEKEELYYLHNELRKECKVGGLTVSSDLEKIAQTHAEFLSKNPDRFYLHSQNMYKGTFLGENKYVGKDEDKFFWSAFAKWGIESDILYKYKDYDYALHLTQMIWKNTKYIGCGRACLSEDCYLVCNYYPPGNILKEFDSNVFIPFYNFVQEKFENLVEEASDSKKVLEKFRKEITERHNYYRKEHNVGELERDSELEKIAQNAAEYMSEIDSIYYSSEKYNGESIGQSFLFNNKFLDGKNVADLWYSQKKNYDFKNPSTKNIPLIKGFTNLVWKKTKKIGCGYACKEKDEKCYYCCTYYPGGIESIFMDNVLPIQELSEEENN